MVTKEARQVGGDVALHWSMQWSRGGHRYLALRGELDLATEARAAEILDYATANLDASDLIIDLTGLEFMDCTGVHLLMRAARATREGPARMAIRALASGPVHRVLTIVGPDAGLDRLLETR